MTGRPGALSARSLGTSLTLHVLALTTVLLIPAGALRRSASAHEVDVVFHRPPPRTEVPVPALSPPPPGSAIAAPLLGGPAKPPASPVVKTEPRPPVPGDPLAPEATGLPVIPEGVPVVEAPPQEKVGNRGILALRDQFASLAENKGAPRLGADARYGAADDVGKTSSHALLTTNAPGSSGGINVASLNRYVGGRGGGSAGGGAGMQGVPVGRATSSIVSIGGGDRPLSHGGPGPSRTDEEIQIVFDRHKAAFYRLYNHELRKDPTLQGQMVLRLTIEPDGSVSMCTLQSTDMDAPDLAAQVVGRVRTMNFGAKEGVQALTIVYPIDFLPAA